MYTLFVFPRKISTISKSDHALNVLQCIDQSMGNPDIVQEIIKTYSMMSIKGMIGMGDNFFNRDLRTGFLVCLDNEGEVDIKSFNKSLIDFMTELDEENIRVQIIRCSGEEKVEKVPELTEALRDIHSVYCENIELILVPLNSLRESLGLPNTIH